MYQGGCKKKAFFNILHLQMSKNCSKYSVFHYISVTGLHSKNHFFNNNNNYPTCNRYSSLLASTVKKKAFEIKKKLIKIFNNKNFLILGT